MTDAPLAVHAAHRRIVYGYIDTESRKRAPKSKVSGSMLNPTPPSHLVDRMGRPYFLWDVDMTLETFRAKLEHHDPKVRGYFLGKMMRQAKPDDVFTFVTWSTIDGLWSYLEPHLGKKRDFWTWLRSVADREP